MLTLLTSILIQYSNVTNWNFSLDNCDYKCTVSCTNVCYYMYIQKVLWKILEAPATFTKPLTDLTTKERDTVTLTCELSKPNTPCKWFKNDTEIQPSNHAQISYDGYTQQLVLTDVTVDDTAKYSCVCGDVSSEATLQVQGMCRANLKININLQFFGHQKLL